MLKYLEHAQLTLDFDYNNLSKVFGRVQKKLVFMVNSKFIRVYAHLKKKTRYIIIDVEDFRPHSKNNTIFKFLSILFLLLDINKGEQYFKAFPSIFERT